MPRPKGSKNKPKTTVALNMTTTPITSVKINPIIKLEVSKETTKEKFIDFDKMIGLECSLYYNNHSNQFQLGDVTFEVIEDEQDGYRSCLKEVKIIDENSRRDPGNFLGTVKITKNSSSSNEIWLLEDIIKNHVWYEFGTANFDDYYPSFVFNYEPILGVIKQILD